jgi:hypothetical protein
MAMPFPNGPYNHDVVEWPPDEKNLQLFKDRFGLTHTLLFNGSLDDENVKKQLHSQMANFIAYPTSIFIDKNHKVRAIHSGFKGGAWYGRGVSGTDQRVRRTR